MTANQLSTRQRKKSITTLRRNFDDVAEAVDELADALEAGEADEDLVADTYRQLAAASVSISDAATFDVIDDEEPRWHAIDNLRASIYHAAHAIQLDESGGRIVAPTPERARNEAITEATGAAEYLELARDDAEAGR